MLNIYFVSEPNGIPLIQFPNQNDKFNHITSNLKRNGNLFLFWDSTFFFLQKTKRFFFSTFLELNVYINQADKCTRGWCLSASWRSK